MFKGYLCNVALWMKRRNPLSRSCRERGPSEPPTLTSLSSRISSKKQTETTVNSKPKKKKHPFYISTFISKLQSLPVSPIHLFPNIQITTRTVARLKGNNAVLNVKFASHFSLCMRKSTLILSMCPSTAQSVAFQVFLIFGGTMRHACVSPMSRLSEFIWWPHLTLKLVFD